MGGITRTPEEIATIIDHFLDGTGGRWDWDDLCSVKIEDPDLDRVRVLCSSTSSRYPPTENGHYCSSQGRTYLRELAGKLREGERSIGW